MVSLGIVTLGCSKNTVDSEVLAAGVAQGRVKVYFDTFPRVDAVVINTCGFIGDAKAESIDAVLQALEWKRSGRVGQVFVMGCLVERFAEQLHLELPEVDGFFGVTDYHRVLKALKQKPLPKGSTQRVLSTPPHYAYLKISEGCDRKCSFCAIPFIRGPQRSRTIRSLLDEARFLADKGVKELNLIAQDTTVYGIDLYGKRRLADLLGQLAGLNLFHWIRLHYTFPSGFPTEVLKVMAKHPSICKYIDIPLQHINDGILHSMKRGATASSTRKLLDRIRRELPGVSIRTAFIVGYPGETRARFTELLRFVEEQRFERLGVFTYSPEEGTAAFRMKETVTERTKHSRAAELMALQQQISLEINQRRVGSDLEVIIDRREKDHYIGRTEFDSPEVDNEVVVSSSKHLKDGSFYKINITGAEEFDLYGRI